MTEKTDYDNIQTPCYLADEKRLRENLSLIREVSRRSGAEIILAFKAFSTWRLFPIFQEYISTATASSLNEARLCLEEMKAPAHTYSPVYKDSEFSEILRCSSHLTFNSLGQWQKYADRARKEAPGVSLGIRINPECSQVAHGIYNPCAPGSRFGVTASDLEGKVPEGIEGFHLHVLFESSPDQLEKVLSAVEEKFGALLKDIKWLNLGGGHLMTRKGYDTDYLTRILKDFQAKHPSLHLILEPGSAFAWETGELITTVEDIVERDGIRTALIDASFTAHMPDCLEMPYQPVILGAASEPIEGRPTYRIGGNSCLSGDVMGQWSFEKPLAVGDRIIFWDMIHYTTVKTTMFNGVHHPSLAIRRMDGKVEILREFSYSDYKSRLS